MASGLSTAEVIERRTRFGYNELPSSQPKKVWQIALEVMKEPMFLLLISCGILYMLLGNYREGTILLSNIFIIIFITFYQYRKTERALEALRNLSAPRALVVRDGKEIRIPGREIVRDDLIILQEGDRIPADAVLQEALNLSVDESLLTGESMPVLKSEEESASAHHLLFSGTLVVQGRGMAKVLATGTATRFGKIGLSLQGIEEDQTRLQREMKKLIRNLFIIGALISLIIVVAFYLTRGHFIQSLLNGLAAAMAILPEEFPVVFTVFLALGAWRLSRKNVLTRKHSTIENLGSATVLCSDKTGTITQNKMQVVSIYNGNQNIDRENFKSNIAAIQQVIQTAKYASAINTSDPMEKAIYTESDTVSETNLSTTLVRSFPLSKKLLSMTQVWQRSDGIQFAAMKGAPETVMELCRMDEGLREKTNGIILRLASKGYRILGVAQVERVETIPDKQQEFAFQFLGLLAFEDPIRPEVSQAIKECHEAGIKVMMITGDYPVTAKTIARQIGLSGEDDLLTGEELDRLSDEVLRQRLQTTNVIARVVPEQKLRIVQALKSNGEVVAMTGDGVNDAPALKAAHIGIAMGGKGTDVAREAASLVLLDDNFASIVAAIRAGRKIFDNLQKAMSYILAIHIPIIGLTLLPAFLPWMPLLLLPLHIVFMELIIDPVCSIAFESEKEETGIMHRPPRNPEETFFGWRKIVFSLLQGVLLLFVVLIVFYLSVREGHHEGEIRAITFTSLIIGNLFFIFTKLSKTRYTYSILLEGNKPLLIITGIALLLLTLTLFVPVLQRTFGFSFPGYSHFFISILAAIVFMLILEGIKLYINKSKEQV